MKIFTIRDKLDAGRKDLAYLLYYEAEKCFNIELPNEIRSRFLRRIMDLLPLKDYRLLVFFRDNSVKKCDLKDYFESDRRFAPLLHTPEYFYTAEIQPGGFAAAWDTNMSIPYYMLDKTGEKIPLTADDFRNFAATRTVNVSEATEILNCTRQNIDYLTKEGKLHPIKVSEKNTLYLKSDVLEKRWK